MVQANNRDSIQSMYPAVISRDSLAIPSGDINVTSVPDTTGLYTVKYGDQVELTVAIDENNKCTILSSRGLFAYNPSRVEEAKKYGQWKAGLNDVELSLRMNDNDFKNNLVAKLAQQVKNNLVAVRPRNDIYEGYLYITVTNNNNVRIDGSDYSLSYTQTGILHEMGYSFEDDSHGTRAGETLDSGESTSYSVYCYAAPAGNYIKAARIKWKISDDRIVDKYYQFTGNEYDEYR